MRALRRHDLASSRRVRMQRAVRASMGPALAAPARRRVGLMSLRGRRARIVGGLWRQIELGVQRRILRFQCGHARRQFLDPRQQSQDQRVLFGQGERQALAAASRPHITALPPACQAITSCKSGMPARRISAGGEQLPEKRLFGLLPRDVPYSTILRSLREVAAYRIFAPQAALGSPAASEGYHRTFADNIHRT
jgi:hypothetical protein